MFLRETAPQHFPPETTNHQTLSNMTTTPDGNNMDRLGLKISLAGLVIVVGGIYMTLTGASIGPEERWKGLVIVAFGVGLIVGGLRWSKRQPPEDD